MDEEWKRIHYEGRHLWILRLEREKEEAEEEEEEYLDLPLLGTGFSTNYFHPIPIFGGQDYWHPSRVKWREKTPPRLSRMEEVD